MPGRQFRLRTLLLVTTVLCLHFAVAGWSFDAFLWVIPCSTFAVTVAAARSCFGATDSKSIASGVAAGTCATAIALAVFGVAQMPTASRDATLILYVVLPALLGGAFGFVISLGAGCVYAGISLLQSWLRNRPDLYYVETDGEKPAAKP